MNPCGSVEDRIAKAIVDDAERRGVLRFDGHPTSKDGRCPKCRRGTETRIPRSFANSS
jgi:hypothetical protein